jgi:hypothetical protein
MRPLPDLTDVEAMAERGRNSALMSARNEACQGLRDECSHINNGRLPECLPHIEAAERWLVRLREVLALMESQ